MFSNSLHTLFLLFFFYVKTELHKKESVLNFSIETVLYNFVEIAEKLSILLN